MHTKQYEFPLFVNAKNNNELAFYCRALSWRLSGVLRPLTHGRLCRTNGANYRKWVRRVLQNNRHSIVRIRQGRCKVTTVRKGHVPSNYYFQRGSPDTLFIVVCNIKYTTQVCGSYCFFLYPKILRNAPCLPVHNAKSFILYN